MGKMDMQRFMRALMLAASLSIPTAVCADSHITGSVADLAWMTGSWSGPMGKEQTLEENWIHQKAGTIGALVRITGADSTSMVELLVIEQKGESLVLHIQQWDPGFAARASGPQTMTLKSIGENQVSFGTSEPGGLSGLTYSRPTDDTFNIDGETGEGAKFQINLKAQ